MSLRRLSQLTFYDFGYLGQIERGERTGSAAVAAKCDTALHAEGMLSDLFASRDKSRTNVFVPAQRTAAHTQGVDAAAEVAPASEADADGITIPCRSADGRIVWVTVPRRAILLGGIAATADLAAAPMLKSGPLVAGNAGGITPVEHLRDIRRVFVDSDNLLGPAHIIPAIQGYIRLIQRLRMGREGADRRALLRLQAEFAEFAGWLYQDSGDFPHAQYWLDRALEWAHAVEDREMAVYVMARKSQLAGDMHDHVSAVDLADAAAAMAVPGSRLQATARTYEAHGHALGGAKAACLQALDEARGLADKLKDGQGSSWASWLDGAYVDVQRARCLSILGNHEHAVAVFKQAIHDLPPRYRRDRGVYLAREARAHAGAHDLEQAAAAGLQALAIAEETGSGRIIHELARLDSDLARWAKVPTVAEFRESLTSFIPRETLAVGHTHILPVSEEAP